MDESEKKHNFEGILVVELDKNRSLKELYWMIKRERNFEETLVDESGKRTLFWRNFSGWTKLQQKFEEMGVDNHDYNRIFKELCWINQIIFEF